MHMRRLGLAAVGLVLALGQSGARGQGSTFDLAGDPLPAGAVARMGTVRLRHVGHVWSVALAPDGSVLASAGDDNLIRLWDPATGRERRQLAGHLSLIYAVAFSPDGKLLASAGADPAVRLWDVAAGTEITVAAWSASRFVTFSPDGKLLAFAGWPESDVRLWDVAGRKEVARLRGQSGVNCAAFAPDGKTLAAGSWGGRGGFLRLWDVPAGREVRWFPRPRNIVASVAFAADGKTLASCGPDHARREATNEVLLWDPSTGSEYRRLPRSGPGVESVCFAPNGKWLATSGSGEATRLWDLAAESGPRLAWQDVGGGNVCFGAGGSLLAWSTEQSIHLFNIATRKRMSAWVGHGGRVAFVAFGDGGKTVVSAGDAVRVWDAGSGRPLRTSTRLKRLACAALAPDRKTLVTGSQDGTTLWDLASVQAVRALPIEHGHAVGAAFAPDGKTLATASYGRIAHTDKRGRSFLSYGPEPFVRLWEPATGKPLGRIGEHRHPSFLIYSADGARLASVSTSIRVWDTVSGKLTARMSNQRRNLPESAGAFSLDGRLLASGEWDGTVILWDTATGKEVRRLRGHDGLVRAAVFAPDGKHLLSAGDDDTARLWDVATGQLLHTLEGHEGGVLAVAFAPDGRRVATASADTTVLVWDLAALKKIVRRPLAALTPRELDALWAGLADNTSGTHPGDRALRRLAAVPASAVPYLRQKLRDPSPPVVKQLLAELDSNRYATRARAARELARMGPAARTALVRAVATYPTLEARRRLEELLQSLEKMSPQRSRDTPESLRLARAVAVLGRAGTPQAKEVLKELARDPGLRRVLDDLASSIASEAQAALQRAR